MGNYDESKYTKAKEIIKALYYGLKKFNKVILYRPKGELLNAIQKAGQFLKNIEVEK